MKKILLISLIMGMMIHPSLSADNEGENEVELTQISPSHHSVISDDLDDANISLNATESSGTFCLRSKKFWCKTAIATCTIGAIAGVTYAIYNRFSNPSPSPSFIESWQHQCTRYFDGDYIIPGELSYSFNITKNFSDWYLPETLCKVKCAVSEFVSNAYEKITCCNNTASDAWRNVAAFLRRENANISDGFCNTWSVGFPSTIGLDKISIFDGPLYTDTQCDGIPFNAISPPC